MRRLPLLLLVAAAGCAPYPVNRTFSQYDPQEGYHRGTKGKKRMSTTHKFQWPTVFSGWRGFTRANLPSEISAGITLAALIIPLNIGYAQVAGLPPVFGLYAGIVPLAVFALFTSSRYVVGSPDAPIAAIMGATLIGFAPIGDPLWVDQITKPKDYAPGTYDSSFSR